MPIERRFARRRALSGCAIVRNITFFRISYGSGDGRSCLNNDSEMERTISGNLQDIAVLECFKLFDDRDARHHCRRHAPACASEGATVAMITGELRR